MAIRLYTKPISINGNYNAAERTFLNMDVKIRAFTILCAASLLTGALSGCARTDIPGPDSQSNGSTVSSPSSESATVSDNVPQFVVTHEEDTATKPVQTQQTPPPTASAVTQEGAPATNAPPATQTPGTSSDAVSSHNIEVTEATTNSNGEIIDDWRSDLVFNTENPDELYSMFGLSRSEREQYYQKISAECELPIIHVSTEQEREVLSKDNYVNCLVEIFNCEDELKMDATSAGIRVRGNASAYYGDADKLRKNGAPYRIKFTHKQSVLGLNDNARCKSWVLLKTYETGVRDHLAFELARAINEGKYYASDSRFVQVYMNEKYMGIYLLCEQCQENPNRVAINECEEGYTGTDIGYYVELDNYSYDEEWRFMLNYNKESITDESGKTRVPKSYYYTVRNDIYSDEQLKFIERYFEVCYEIPMRAIKYGEFYRLNDDFSLTLAQDEFASARECVSQVLDLESFVDMYITYEIVNDQDVGGGSFFFAVDFGNVSMYKTLTCVSPWDFSWAYTDYNAKAKGGLYAANFKDSYFVGEYGDRSNPWLILLYSADWFRDMVKEKWAERYPAILETLSEVRSTVNTYSSDFDKDGAHRASRARATLDWTDSRVEYLNGLWG